MPRTVFVDEGDRMILTSTLVEWLERGDSIQAIAQRCNVTPQTIHYQLGRRGLSYSRTQGWRKNGA